MKSMKSKIVWTRKAHDSQEQTVDVSIKQIIGGRGSTGAARPAYSIRFSPSCARLFIKNAPYMRIGYVAQTNRVYFAPTTISKDGYKIKSYVGSTFVRLSTKRFYYLDGFSGDYDLHYDKELKFYYIEGGELING